MRNKTLTHRDGWEREERRRVEDALAEAHRWQAIEPHKTDFWETFWGSVVEIDYPEWQWRRQPQTDLAQFCDD